VFELADDKSVSTPFGAVVGQPRLKEALLCVAADDGLDGLLVTGEKGTAKSTLVRGLAELLPDQRVVADCPYGCPPDDRDRQCSACRERATYPVETRSVPLVTLPLGASRDRVVGTLSVSDALSGEAAFDPGLLARANRGILYVDEVNLLDDHLVDVLLDAAASGVNRVERDGVSRTHPAEFTLVGTMNPEEGDLRPQLRDRFALSVEVEGVRDIDDRIAIIDDDLGADRPERNDDTETHRERLLGARELLGSVALTDGQKREIAELCVEAGVDGHRADIATARAARALAALDGRPTVTDGDIRTAASFALGHRMRSTPFEDAPDAEDVIDDHFDDNESGADGEDTTDGADGEDDGDGESDDPDADSADTTDGDDADTDSTDADTSETDDTDGEGGNDTRSERDGPGTESGSDESTEGDGCDPTPTEADPDPSDGNGGDDDGSDDNGSGGDEEATPLVPGASAGVAEPTDRAAAPDIDAPSGEDASGSGRADSTPSTRNEGVRIRTEPADSGGPVDAAASVRAAASRGADRVETRDLRQSVRSGSGEALVVFAVDASAIDAPRDGGDERRHPRTAGGGLHRTRQRCRRRLRGRGRRRVAPADRFGYACGPPPEGTADRRPDAAAGGSPDDGRGDRAGRSRCRRRRRRLGRPGQRRREPDRRHPRRRRSARGDGCPGRLCRGRERARSPRRRRRSDRRDAARSRRVDGRARRERTRAFAMSLLPSEQSTKFPPSEQSMQRRQPTPLDPNNP